MMVSGTAEVILLFLFINFTEVIICTHLKQTV